MASSKSECRKSKQIRNSNERNRKEQRVSDQRSCTGAPGFDIVSDFVFRASDFGSKTAFSMLHCAVVLTKRVLRHIESLLGAAVCLVIASFKLNTAGPEYGLVDYQIV